MKGVCKDDMETPGTFSSWSAYLAFHPDMYVFQWPLVAEARFLTDACHIDGKQIKGIHHA
jgi:hypothetical protein